MKSFSSFWGPLILVFFVYIYIFFQASNFENTWMQPELIRIKEAYLKTGPTLVSKDFFNIWDWRINEREPRPTRWLSWHLDFLDTKFRVWLWQLIPPHPSFSLTWLWILFFNPWLLFTYLRLRQFSVGIALTVMAFYLMTPATLSGIFMLFRSAKVLVNFFMLIALVMVCLCERYPRKKLYFAGFCLALMLGAFSDETAFFILPLLGFLHPKFIFKKLRWLWILLVILLVAVSYGWGMKVMCHYVSGTPLSGLGQYRPFCHIFDDKFARQFMNNIGLNSVTLCAQTMGLAMLHQQAPLLAKVLLLLGSLAWSIMFMMTLIRKDFWETPVKVLFPWVALFLLAFWYNNFLLSMLSNQTWGPYYYGNYFSILFSLALAFFFKFVMPETFIRTILMGMVLCLMGNMFLYTNKIFKQYHFYPKRPLAIQGIFVGQEKYFDPRVKTNFSSEQLKGYINTAWKSPDNYRQWRMPEELYWLVVELNGFKKNYNPYYSKHEGNDFYFYNPKFNEKKSHAKSL